ncbi:MAG: GTP-binding protein [Minwuia thermotolerans]|nr:MAG: GTP-binding protein [Minwuia thermotolerans]
MRIRTFTARSMSEALRLVRQELGRDAVILGNRDVAEGVEVTAAIDPTDEPVSDSFQIQDRDLGPNVLPLEVGDDEDQLPEEAERLLRAVAFHGAPLEVNEKLCRRAAQVNDPSLTISLAAGVEEVFRFSPFGRPSDNALVLVGPPGAGKTVVAAKYAVESVLSGRPLKIATTDIERPGGEMRLMELAEILDNRPVRLTPGRRLEWSGPRIIDTEGVNPFDDSDIQKLRETIEINDAEPVLVLPAGGDPYEYEDIAYVFAELGVTRLVATRIDTARRIGGILAAASTGLSFAAAGASPVIADGLYPLTPTALARLILNDPDGAAELDEDRKHA